MTGAQKLRHAIDTGATGDKVEWPDPVVAPLGIDGEAGGHARRHDCARIEVQMLRVLSERHHARADADPPIDAMQAGRAAAMTAVNETRIAVPPFDARRAGRSKLA